MGRKAAGLGSLAAAVAAGLAVVLAGADAARAEWPERAVTVIVPAAAGGGTDATGRLLSKQLQEILGQPFNIVNQGEGSGVVGHTAIATAKPDGYTLGIIYNFAQMKLMGQADLTAESFTPVAQFNFDPSGFHVSAGSEHETLTSALDDIKAHPGQYKISCGGGCGGSWHLPMAAMFIAYGIDPKSVVMIPSKGAAPGLQELVAGGVDFITCSLPEAGPLIAAGQVRPLTVISLDRVPAFPDVPTAEEQIGEPVSGGAWRGVAGPAGLPDEIVSRMEDALRQIGESDEFRNAMTERGFGMMWRDHDEFGAFLKEHEAETRRIMEALDMVQG